MKILFLGGAYRSHLMIIAHGIKMYDESIQLDWYTQEPKPTKFAYEFDIPFNNVFYPVSHFPKFFYRIPGLRAALMAFDYKHTLKKFFNQGYTVVHLQFINSSYRRCLNYIGKIANTFIITPWGSDIYRASKIELKKYQRLFDHCNYITCLNQTMLDYLATFYANISGKLLLMPVTGYMPIDNILKNQLLDRELAKDKLNFKGSFVITCGTNGAKSQQHDKILDALTRVKEKLPANLVIVMQLGRGDADYDTMIKEKLENSGLNYRYFDYRISDNEMLYLRKSTDLLIHAQPTDSDSGALKEAMLCDTIVVNASWLKYPHHEKYGVPYYVFDSFDQLGSVVVRACENKDNIFIPRELKEDLKKSSLEYASNKWISFYKEIQ